MSISKEELLALLQEHLSIDVEHESSVYGSGDKLRVSIKFAGEEVADAFEYLPSADDTYPY